MSRQLDLCEGKPFCAYREDRRTLRGYQSLFATPLRMHLKITFRTSQRTHSIHITKTNHLMLYTETVAVCRHTERVNTACASCRVPKYAAHTAPSYNANIYANPLRNSGMYTYRLTQHLQHTALIQATQTTSPTTLILHLTSR